MLAIRNRRLQQVAAIFVSLALVHLCLPASVWATAAELSEAQGDFLLANYEDALNTVSALIDAGELGGTDLRDAYVLRARCQIKMGEANRALDSFCEVRRLSPEWRPDPLSYTPSEMATFEDSARECSSTGDSTPNASESPARAGSGDADGDGGGSWFTKPIFLIGSAAAVVGIALIALGGDDDSTDGDGEPLPDFPDPPEG